MGRKIRVTMVINLRVRGEEAAFWIVRLQFGFRLDTITRGYKKAKIVSTMKVTVRQVIRNTRPECPLRKK